MTNVEALKAAIKESGVTVTFIASKMNCSRTRIYSIIKGADCTATEIAELTSILHLSKQERDHIFLSKNVN